LHRSIKFAAQTGKYPSARQCSPVTLPTSGQLRWQQTAHLPSVTDKVNVFVTGTSLSLCLTAKAKKRFSPEKNNNFRSRAGHLDDPQGRVSTALK